MATSIYPKRNDSCGAPPFDHFNPPSWFAGKALLDSIALPGLPRFTQISIGRLGPAELEVNLLFLSWDVLEDYIGMAVGWVPVRHMPHVVTCMEVILAPVAHVLLSFPKHAIAVAGIVLRKESNSPMDRNLKRPIPTRDVLGQLLCSEYVERFPTVECRIGPEHMSLLARRLDEQTPFAKIF